MDPTAILTLAERFALIMQAAIQTVSVRWRAGNVPLSAIWRPALSPALINLVCGRMLRARRQFDALAARVRAGTLPAPRRRAAARRVATRPHEARARPAAPDAIRIPRRAGWLIPLVPEVGGYGGWLQQLLAEPDMAAVVAACPGMARTLRPLCRMLGIPMPDFLAPPPRPCAPSETRARSRAASSRGGSRPALRPAPGFPQPPPSRRFACKEARGLAVRPSDRAKRG